MSFEKNDTIAAISTSIGPGGIGIVRISGPEALAVADAVFIPSGKDKPSECPSHTVHYGHVRQPETSETLDEALISVMRSPRTYTLEDIVEISCHGGQMSLKKVLNACIIAGSRIAEPGEFTKRAFVNGRIDLAQAEAVMDIISSETEKAQRLALCQLEGGFSARVEEFREKLIGILALIELALDFSGEDVEMPSGSGVLSEIRKIARDIEAFSGTARGGMMVRYGSDIVICGKPNVGKSSLMNALLKHERVIVTPIAGTTRDVVEESIILDGVKVRLSDTAGIVDTEDRVEKEGIRRSREKLSSADLVIFMVDSSSGVTEQDIGIYNAVKLKKNVIAVNKTDLDEKVSAGQAAKIFANQDVVMISALKKRGLEELERAITKKLFSESPLPSGESPVIMNARHADCMEKAVSAARKAMETAESGGNFELIATDIRESAHYLGLITGKTIEDDVLGRIFSGFCIGK